MPVFGEGGFLKMDGSKAWAILFTMVQLFIGIAGLLIVRTMDRVENTLVRFDDRQSRIEREVATLKGQMKRSGPYLEKQFYVPPAWVDPLEVVPQ